MAKRKSKKKRIIATHVADLDGIGSAAVLKRKFPDAQVHFLDYPTADDSFEWIYNKNPDEVYVADFNLGESNHDAIEYIEDMAKDTDIYWFDHHRWDKKMEKRTKKVAKKFVMDHTKCGTELAQEYCFDEDEKISKRIAKYARFTDFGGSKNTYASRLADLIAATRKDKNFLREIVDDLSQGIFWKDEFDEIRTKYLEDRAKKAAEAMERAHYYKADFDGDEVTIGIAYADRLLKGGYMSYMLSKSHKIDMSVILFDHGAMSFRANNWGGSEVVDKIDLSEWSREYFGGGGHKGAAGAQYGKDFDDKEIGEVMDDIIKTLPLKNVKRRKISWEELN